MKWAFIYKRIFRFVSQRQHKPYVSNFSQFCWDTFRIYENHNYNPQTNGEYKLLEKLRKFDFTCFFDVGANVGNWSIQAAKSFPRSNIYAFEIMEEPFKELSKKCMIYPSIKSYNVGLSDKDEELQMREYEGASEHASLYDYNDQPARIISRKAISGDNFLKDNNITQVGLIKIDTEGHDLAVLKGFEGALQKKLINVVQFEYGKPNILSRALLYDFFKFFEGHGYLVGKIFPHFVRFKPYDFFDENFIGPNFIAVRNDRTDIIEAIKKVS